MFRILLFACLFLSLWTDLKAQCVSGNCINGSGVMVYASGARYIGEFKNAVRDGFGTCFYPDGGNYKGYWSRDRHEGPGIRAYGQGTVKKGYWRQGTLVTEDPGLVLQTNGKANHISVGCISGNCATGQGIYIYDNGDIYSGEFSGGRRQGSGICYFSDGTEYKGSWKNDQMDGRGTISYSDGRVQSGVWKLGNMQESTPQVQNPVYGYGNTAETTAPFPVVVARCLSGDCQNGFGTYLFQDSSRYTGTFRNGVPEGRGSIYYANGERFEGAVKEGLLNGRGTIFFPDGRRVSGDWEAGVFMQSIVEEVIKPGPAPAVPVYEKPAERPAVKVWAVIVGIASYSHMPMLRYTDDDAYRIYAFLKAPEGGAVPDEQIRLLIDESATREAILKAMQDIFYKAGPNDLVLMYFSGHGLPGTFLPIDYDGLRNQIRHEEVNMILRRSPAKLKLFIADACHSGSMITARDGKLPLLQNYYTTLAKAQAGTALIMSSKSEETSLEASGLRQGVFSYFLIRGLKGEGDINNDGVVTVQELFDFVFANVRQYTLNRQSPVIQGDYDPKMTVAVYDR
jgi:hypothetical protein